MNGSFTEALVVGLSALWGCYTNVMEIVNFPGQFHQVGASGVCPHCQDKSYFRPVGTAHLETEAQIQSICNAAQCESCKKFALVVGDRRQGSGTGFGLRAFFPLGRPRDFVDKAVPPDIASDFREALRCRWIEAYKATVTMCRRAIQASCLAKGVDPKKRLVDQIDDLASKGVITEPLKQFAHEVRLEGNDGAHPDKDGLAEVADTDADDIIEFTREYLHHVYVMPAKLQARKPAAAAAAPATGSTT